MSLSNNFNVFINIFVHYPEVYNSTVINNKLNNYIKKYFSNNKPLNSVFNGNTYVMIKTAPHNENQVIIIDIEFSNQVDESILNSNIMLEWKEYFGVYFDKQIQEIYINFIN
jgi:hypothetical protein